MQHDTATIVTDSTESSEKKSLKISLEFIESDSMIDNIFGMAASVETNIVLHPMKLIESLMQIRSIVMRLNILPLMIMNS